LPSVRVGLRRVLGRELGCYLATMEDLEVDFAQQPFRSNGIHL
jgi:hypothetical protein